MELWQYILASIVSYLGILCGYYFVAMAPEEKVPGMKYFNLFNHLLFAGCIFTAAFFLHPSTIIIILFLLFAVLYFISSRHHPYMHMYVSYAFFAVLYYFLSENSRAIMTFSSMVFLYGLTAGAIMIDLKQKKKSLYAVLGVSFFVVVCVLLKLIL